MCSRCRKPWQRTAPHGFPRKILLVCYHHLREIIAILDTLHTVLCHCQDTLTTEHVGVHLGHHRKDASLLSLVVEDRDLFACLILELCSLQRVSDNDRERLA